MSGTAISTSVRILWRMLEHRGIDPMPLFKEVGIDSEQLNNPQIRYQADKMRLAWTRAAELTDDPAFGLSIAEVWQPTDFHALGYAFMASMTLRKALDRLVRFNAVVDSVVSFSVVERGDQVLLSYSAEHSEVDEPAILEDARWAVVLGMCRQAYGADLDPLDITFLHPEPSTHLGEFFGQFRCPMRFGEPVATMTFPVGVLDNPLPASNRELACAHDRILTDIIGKLKRDDIVSRVKSAIFENLPEGHLTDKTVAEVLHMSPRTLQRKLAAEDTSFRNLVEEIRRELAEAYLADDKFSIIEISYLLGFSDKSSFYRAFKRWTSSTPQEFRSTDS